MKKISVGILLLLAFAVIATPAYAKLLPRFQGTAKPAGNTTSSGKVAVTVRFRGDRHAILASFANLSAAQVVNYMFTYQTNGKDEGVNGTIKPQGQDTTQRELLFGTCSSGVCRYHTNITNAKLEVTITPLSGKKTIKRFRIKV